VKKILAFLSVAFTVAFILSVVSCTAADPFPEDIYFGDVYSNGVLLVPGGGGDMLKVTYDPANIGQQLVGLTAAQSLTNKQLTMNNGDIIYWKNGIGVAQPILFLGGGGFHVLNPTGSGLNFNYDTAGSIYLWGSDEGTGEVMVLYGSNDVTALAPLNDSPSLELAAWYWDGGAAAGRMSGIIHDMITSGAAPKSQLKLSVGGLDILRLENNNGVIKTFSDGATHIGGAGNYTLFAADGKQTMAGTARVDKDEDIPLTALGKGAAAPATVYIGNYIGYEFTINDTAYFSTEIPYDWDSTTALEIEIHWYINEAFADAPNGEVRWNIIYTATQENITEAVDAATTTIDSGDINIPATAKYLVQTIFSIPAASLQAHDVIGVQVKRVALVGGTNPTAKPTLVSAMIEYRANRLGE